MDTGALIVPANPSPILKRGIERIENKSPQAVDVLYGRAPDDPMVSAYDWVVVLDEIGIAVGDSLEDDSWAVETSGEKPAQVSIRAQTERARLFALYHIAGCLDIGTPVSEWSVERRPLLQKRYALISGGNVWSKVARPDWVARDIEDLPAMGMNGVLFYPTPTHGSMIGRQTIPLSLTEDGVVVDESKLAAFHYMFDHIKTYGLDIGLMHQAFIPSQFTMEEVRKAYDGEVILDGLDEAIEKTSCEMADAIFTRMPQVDSLFFHSLECEWMWGRAVAMFPCKNDEACGRAFEAYLTGMLRACDTHGKTLMFWTHVSGIPARQIRLIHEILERYPTVLVMEDHKWPNNTWPHSPVMGHIAEDIQDTVTARRWGMSIDTTDGEYYGGGALPTAYPDPHVLSGQVCVERGAECAFIRFNAQALTPQRTMEDVNGIHLAATSETWWTPARPMDVLWSDWCTRRFGKEAAPAVVTALKKSEAIILKGLSTARHPLIDHSALLTQVWKPGSRMNAWGIFARPGELLVDKPWDALTCPEIRLWQVNGRGVALDDFLQDNTEARDAAGDALKAIESVHEYLAAADYTYLKTCFEDAMIMMDAIRYAAIGARASVLYMEDTSETNLKALQAACEDLEACADRIESEKGIDFRPAHHLFKTRLNGAEIQSYGTPISLRVIAGQYRNLISP